MRTWEREERRGDDDGIGSKPFGWNGRIVGNGGGASGAAAVFVIPHQSPPHSRVATFFDAVDIMAITYALPAFAGPWNMSPQQIGLVMSSAFFGQFIGALFAGWAAESFGRLARSPSRSRSIA